MSFDPLAYCSILQEQLRWWRRIASLACLLAVLVAAAAALQHWATWVVVDRMMQAEQDQEKAERDTALLIELVEDQRRELSEAERITLHFELSSVRRFEDSIADPNKYLREIEQLSLERGDPDPSSNPEAPMPRADEE